MVMSVQSRQSCCEVSIILTEIMDVVSALVANRVYHGVRRYAHSLRLSVVPTLLRVSFCAAAIHELFNLLAVNAIGLTDAFDYSDYDLNSALAQYEGKPYETLLEWAHKLEPLNRQQVSSGYTKHLHKLYRAKL